MRIVIFIDHGVTALDVIGPYTTFSRLPNVEIIFAAREIGLIRDESRNLIFNATHSIFDIDKADILLIGHISPELSPGIHDDRRVLDWIKDIHNNTQYTITVCGGSFFLAKAGLLEGLKATSHWAYLDLLSKYGAIPVSERVICEGRIVTSAGVSSGIDMGLYILNLIMGEEFAKLMQLGMEYDPEPPFEYKSVKVELLDKAKIIFKDELDIINKYW